MSVAVQSPEHTQEAAYSVEGVRRLIAPYVATTAIEHYDIMGHGNIVTAKLESTQYTGSFKFRGGVAKLLELGRPAVTASAGNFAAGLSYAGRVLEIPTTVVVPQDTYSSRLDNVRQGNADIRIVRGNFEEAQRIARSMDGKDMAYTSAFDDPIVMAAHGTMVAEFLQQNPHMDIVFVTAGGAGAVAGALMAVHESGSSARVVAVQLAGNNSLGRSLRAGSVQETRNVNAAVCEGSAVRRIGGGCLRVIQEHVAMLDIITVPVAGVGRELVYEDRKRQTLVPDMGAAAFLHFPEPTGILAAAGAREYATRHPELQEGNWGVVITGSNVDPARELRATEAFHMRDKKKRR